jgi:septum formation protein
MSGSHERATRWPIVLASTSPYRRELLARLRLPFEVRAPAVDETPQPDESPAALALRLARAKARSVAAVFPGSIVIGSDQVAELDGRIIGKPLEHEAALDQLVRMQGRRVCFHTALAVAHPDGTTPVEIVPTTVSFRRLERAALDRYLKLDRPYDCAGAAKVESLGIALLDAVESNDPTALIGLPLIRLASMLADAGVAVFEFR